MRAMRQFVSAQADVTALFANKPSLVQAEEKGIREVEALAARRSNAPTVGYDT
jgi:hypothetical protein